MNQVGPGHSGRKDPSSDPGAGLPEAIGQSEAFLAFQERLSRVASVDRPVLLIGERGTGKELAAARLHYLSRRWQGPLIALNCAALASSLIESELFGYEKGAFTGASMRRTGRFEAADRGTLLLDEIGAIPLEVQEKILRVVEYGGFERVGSSRGIDVDVRIIGATNADLPAMALKGSFKPDLLDRLSFEVLSLPPLRERREDIPILAAYFSARMAFELGRKEAPRFSPEALERLESYAWPGNVRELKNVVERAVYRAESDRITELVFDPFQGDTEWPSGVSLHGAGVKGEEQPAWADLMDMPLREALNALEHRRLLRALVQARHNQKRAARLLGLTYHQFRGLYRKHRAVLEEAS